MGLTVYNGEYFSRSKQWFVIFFIIVGAVIFASFLSKNRIGGVMILLFVGGYFFFLSKTNKDITIKAEENGLWFHDKYYERNAFSGFVLEYHLQTEQIHNIVFLTPKGHIIFTIHDTTEHLQEFVQTVTQLGNLDLKDQYEQTLREKVSRKLKL